MKVLVGVKRVIDYSSQKIKVKGGAVDLTGAKMYVNPFCEIAMQQAAIMKEQKKVKSITALSIGPPNQQKILWGPLALGADKAIYVHTDLRHDTQLQPLLVAKTLMHFIKRDQYDLVLLGKQSVDDDFNQTGQLLAGLLRWPQATFASKIKVNDGGSLDVTREVDSGLQTLNLKLPAVVTCDLRLNTPKIPSLPNMMKAKKAPIEKVDFKTLNIPASKMQVLESMEPAKRKGGVIVKDVDELISKLQKEAKII